MATEEDLARHFKSPSPPPCSPPPSISMVPYYQGSGQSPMDKLLQNRQQSVSMAAPTNSEESEMATEEYLIYLNSPSPSSNSMVVYYQGSGQSSMDNRLQNRQQQSVSSNSDDGVLDQFPVGLRVLVVDDDPHWLMILEKMLRKCLYEVTKCNRAWIALSLLRERKNGFDIVLSDVNMPDMDGFKLLQHVGLEMDLPVIMMSEDASTRAVMKGVTHGACDYLIKPVSAMQLRNIWKHVVRKRLEDTDFSLSENESSCRKSKRQKEEEDEAEENRDDTSTIKKPRVVWSVELHQQFVAPVNQLGIDISQSKLKSSCREYGIHRWPPRDEHKLVRQSLPDEIPAIVDQDGILQLISNCVPSNQPLMATVETNSVVKEIPPPWISLTAQQENQDENFATDEVDVIGMGGVGTGEGEMEVGQLNSGCSGKGKRIEKTSKGERGNNKTTGVRIAIPLEDILQTKEMRLKDAAKHLNVSRSTLKRACREYNIYRWPPREELKLLSQYSLPNKSPTVVDQGQIPQLNDDTLLPSNQVPATVNTNRTATVKARCGKETIKFRLSWPWVTVELKQQVKKRLELEDGTYYIKYKDEDNELILIACDDDLQECISSSSPLGSKSIEILLEPK